MADSEMVPITKDAICDKVIAEGGLITDELIETTNDVVARLGGVQVKVDGESVDLRSDPQVAEVIRIYNQHTALLLIAPAHPDANPTREYTEKVARALVGIRACLAALSLLTGDPDARVVTLFREDNEGRKEAA